MNTIEITVKNHETSNIFVAKDYNQAGVFLELAYSGISVELATELANGSLKYVSANAVSWLNSKLESDVFMMDGGQYWRDADLDIIKLLIHDLVKTIDDSLGWGDEAAWLSDMDVYEALYRTFTAARIQGHTESTWPIIFNLYEEHLVETDAGEGMIDISDFIDFMTNQIK